MNPTLEREWLVTNGLGGFASGTVALANTRRYHGLLVSSFKPPVDRLVLVAKVDLDVAYRGRHYALTTQRVRRRHARAARLRAAGVIPARRADSRLDLRHRGRVDRAAHLVLRRARTPATCACACSRPPLRSTSRSRRCAPTVTTTRTSMATGCVRSSPGRAASACSAHDGAHEYRVSVDTGRFETRPQTGTGTSCIAWSASADSTIAKTCFAPACSWRCSHPASRCTSWPAANPGNVSTAALLCRARCSDSSACCAPCLRARPTGSHACTWPPTSSSSRARMPAARWPARR